MNTTRQESLMQHWHVAQRELLHEIALTQKLERLVHMLE
jgi:hypothetical protein